MNEDRTRQLNDLEAAALGAVELMKVAAERMEALDEHKRGERNFPMGSNFFPEQARQAAETCLAEAKRLRIKVKAYKGNSPRGLPKQLATLHKQLLGLTAAIEATRT